MGGPHVSEGDDRNITKLLDVAGWNPPCARDCNSSRFRQPHLEAARHRDLGRPCAAAASTTRPAGHPDGRRHSMSMSRPAVLVATTTSRRGSATARRTPTTTRRRVLSSPVRSSGPASITSASRRRTRRITVQELVLRSDRHGRVSRRTSTTSTRAGGRPTPWLTSCRTGTGPAATTVTVYVYNNCDSVELFLNNASQGSKTMSSTTLRARVERAVGIGDVARGLQESAAAWSRPIR